MTVNNPDNIILPSRSVTDLLAGVNRTKTLSSFMMNVVDNLYQPEASADIQGYLGRRPSYASLDTDVYINHPTLERDFYSLEPTVIRTETDPTKIVDSIFYKDFINYLGVQGAAIGNEGKMFISNTRSWMPPIDADKFNNYTNYLWIEFPTPWEIFGNESSYTTDSITFSFSTNSPGLDGSKFIVSLDNIVLNYNIDYTIQYSSDNIAYVVFATAPLGGKILKINSPYRSSDWETTSSVTIVGFGSLSNGHRIKLMNDLDPSRNGKIFIVEGVGRQIILIPDDYSDDSWDNFAWDYNNIRWDYTPVFGIADYTTIQRGSKNGNKWSTMNRWFHINTLKPEDISTNSGAKAKRNIIEFDRNLELFNFGHTYVGNVDLIYDKNLDIINDIINPSGDNWNSSVLIDGIHPKDGDLIFVKNSSNVGSINHVYKLELTLQPTGFITAALIPVSSGRITVASFVSGNVIYVTEGNVYGDQMISYSGSEWTISQNRIAANQEPLFQLYDMNYRKLQDNIVYPGSNFIGSPIFAYLTASTSPVDSVLSKRVVRNNTGACIFHDYMFYIDTKKTRYYTFNSGNITSKYVWRNIGASTNLDVYGDNYWQQPIKSRQALVYQFQALASTVIYKLLVNPDSSLADTRPNKNGVIIELDGKVYDNWTLLDNIVTITNVSFPALITIRIFTNDNAPDDYFWEIPKSLEVNSNLEPVSNIGANEMFIQLRDMISSQIGINGSPAGSNNSRDLRVNRGLGSHILMSESSTSKAMATVANRQYDIIAALMFAERAASRWRMKFIQMIKILQTSTDLNESTPAADWVDAIITELAVGKNQSFPYSLSNVGGRNSYAPPSPAYLGLTRLYLPKLSDDDTFPNTTRVIECHDGSILPAFGDFRDNILLEWETRVYNSAPPHYKTNLVATHNPKTWYAGKFRRSSDFNKFYHTDDAVNWNGTDPLLISTNTTYKVNNIFYIGIQNSSVPIVLTDALDNQLLTEIEPTTYDRNVWVNIEKSEFQRWIMNNQLDYRRNDRYVPFDPWSFNYHGIKDKDGDELPGYWRGIYLFYYDTTRPHTHPWEMLGFGTKPAYWDIEYGISPYTRGNSKLWQDLEVGFIRGYGIVPEYARPGLLKVLPVDDNGILLNPLEIGIVSDIVPHESAVQDWEYGDVGPVEYAWRMSDSYSFSLTMAAFLSRPGVSLYQGWGDAQQGYSYGNDYADQPDTAGPIPIINNLISDPMHGQLINKQLTVRYGYQQIISDYNIQLGLTLDSLSSYFQKIDVRLGSKLSGYIDTDGSIFKMSGGKLLQPEDISVLLYKSPPQRQESHSGVIVEWTGQGWRIYGYDPLLSHFKILKSDRNSPSIAITAGLGELPDVASWAPNTPYNMGAFIKQNDTYFRSNRDHVSGISFDPNLWTLTKLSPEPIVRVLEWSNYSNTPTEVPYFTTFYSRQDVYDFIVSYGKYLENQGWIYPDVDSITGEALNWRFSGKEFLTWSIEQWSPGTFITLNPNSLGLSFEAAQGYINSIDEPLSGIPGLVDKQGLAIDSNKVNIYRRDFRLLIEPIANITIFGARLTISEIEHVVIFNNVSKFNDTLYNPTNGSRMDRVFIRTRRTLGWNGRTYSPGYFLTNTSISNNIPKNVIGDGSGLRANYEKSVDDIKNRFDIINPPMDIATDRAWALGGFRQRTYLDILGTSDGQAYQFMAGANMVKGTKQILDRLARNNLINGTINYGLYETWAFLLSEFGGSANNKALEIQLKKSQYRNKSQLILFYGLTLGDISDGGWDENIWDSDPDTTLSWDPLLEDASGIVQGYHNDNEDVILVTDEYSQTGQLLKLNSLWLNRPTDIIDSSHLPRTSTSSLNIWNLDYDPSVNNSKLSIAGNVLINETTWQYPSISQLKNDTTLYDGIGPHQLIWIYRLDGLQKWSQWPFTWTVARVTNPNIQYESIIQSAIPVSQFVSTTAPSVTRTRLILPNITCIDEGDLIVIPDDTDTSISLKGIYECICKDTQPLYDENNVQIGTQDIIEIDIAISESVNFMAEAIQPRIYVLKEVRFTTRTDRNNKVNKYFPYNSVTNPDGKGFDPFIDGELIWINDYYGPNQWNVQFYSPIYTPGGNGPSVLTSRWRYKRRSVNQIDTNRIDSGSIRNFNNGYLDVAFQPFDPVKGIHLAPIRENIQFITDENPANYFDPLTGTDDGSWGKDQVGTLWWNTSTTFYLDYETMPELFIDVNRYRWHQWGKLAPKSTADVYEWTRSSVPPSEYLSQTTLSNTEITGSIGEQSTQYITRTEYDLSTSTKKTYYYFWVLKPTIIPNGSTRNLPASEISRIIEDPINSNIAWWAPINSNAVVVNDVGDVLNEDTSGLHLQWKQTNSDNSVHREWRLIREGDPTDILPSKLVNKVRDSMVEYDVDNNPVPDSALLITERYGLNNQPRQTLYKYPMEARRNFYSILTLMFDNVNIVDDRPDIIQALSVYDPAPTYKAPFIVPITGQFITVHGYGYFTLPDTFDKTQLVIYRVSTDGTAIEIPRVKDAIAASALDGSDSVYSFFGTDGILFNPRLQTGEYLVVNQNNAYQTILDTKNLLDTISPYNPGMHYLISNDISLDGIWGNYVAISDSEYILHNAQLYRLAGDLWNYTDWYAVGYDASMRPSLSFTSIAARNSLKRIIPDGSLVQVTNINNKWEWYIRHTISDSWTKVAGQDHTIEFNSQAWTSTILWGINNNFDPAAFAPRSMLLETRIAYNQLMNEVFTEEEQHSVFFKMIRHSYNDHSFIPWMFKTSEVYLSNLSQALIPSPTTIANTVEAIEDYVMEVKPYHVKVRNSFNQYSIIDYVPTNSITDFDKPPYFDPILGQTRILDPNNPDDLRIIEASSPSKDWLWATKNDPSRIRSFEISMLFDRVSCLSPESWDTEPDGWDTTFWDSAVSWWEIPNINSNIILDVKSNGVSIPYTIDSDKKQLTIYESNSQGSFASITWSTITGSISTGLDSEPFETIPLEGEPLEDIIGEVIELNVFLHPGINTIDLPYGPQAHKRIFDSYVPQTGMVENDLNKLIAGCDFPGFIYDGGSYQDLMNDLYDVYVSDENPAPYLMSYHIFDTNNPSFNINTSAPKSQFIIPDGIEYTLSDIHVYYNRTLLAPETDYVMLDNSVMVIMVNNAYNNLPNSLGLTRSDLVDSTISIIVTNNSSVVIEPYTVIITGSTKVRKNGSPAGIPEELYPIRPQSNILLSVDQRMGDGGPESTINRFFGNGGSTYQLFQQPQSNYAVQVFKDGMLLTEGSDYVYDVITQSVNFAAPTTLGAQYQLVSYGFGGLWDGYDTLGWDEIGFDAEPSHTDILYRSSTGVASYIFTEIDPSISYQILATVNGIPVNASLSGQTVTFASPPIVGADIFVNIISSNNGMTVVNRKIVNGPIANPILLPQVSDTDSSIYESVRVYRTFTTGDTYLLTPPYHDYKFGDGIQTLFPINTPFISASNVIVKYGNNTLIQGTNYSITGNSIELLPGTNIIGEFLIMVKENYDYEMTSTGITLTSPLLNNEKLIIQQHTNNTSNRTRLMALKGHSDGIYITPFLPRDYDSITLYVNGVLQVYATDFVIERYDIVSGFNTYGFDSVGFDSTTILSGLNRIRFIVGHAEDDDIVAYITTNHKPMPKGRAALWKRWDTTEAESAFVLPQTYTYDMVVGTNIMPNDRDITIKINELVPNQQVPTVLFNYPDSDLNIPARLWIGNELVEFWKIDGTGNIGDPPIYDGTQRILKLHNVRRGAQVTPSGVTSDLRWVTYTGTLGPVNIIDSINKTFNLPIGWTTLSRIHIWINNQIQNPNTYVVTTAGTVIFNTAPIIGNTIKILAIVADSDIPSIPSHYSGERVWLGRRGNDPLPANLWVGA